MGKTPPKTQGTVEWPEKFLNNYRLGCRYCKVVPHPICSRCEILLHHNKKRYKCQCCQDTHGNRSTSIPSLCQDCANILTKRENRATLEAQ